MELTFTVISLILVACGWVTSYLFGRKRDRELEITKIRLNHVNEQLSVFYGQVYGLLLENDRVRRQVQEQLGRQIVFEGGRSLEPDEEKLWVHFLENYFLPNNRKIIDLITNNVHLWTGNSVPPSYLKFLDYAIGFESLHKQFKDLDREYGFHFIESFPQEFRNQIVDTVTRLKHVQWVLVNTKKT